MMKKASLMLSFLLFSRLIAAEGLDVAALRGEYWYGLYINGQKSGYSEVSRDVLKDGRVEAIEDAHFRVTMAGQPQDMRVRSRRVYGADGALALVDTEVNDASGKSTFHGETDHGAMKLTLTVAGATRNIEIPAPKETIQDLLRQERLASKDAKVGDEVSFTTFEAAYQRELKGTLRVEAIEERNLDGATAKVFKIKTTLPEMGVDSVSYVAQGGTVLEDETAGFIKMRLEPKETAQDVTYSNDVIVSNAAPLDAPLAAPRTRPELRLRVEGPLAEDHRFKDARQRFEPMGSAFLCVTRKLDPATLKSVTRPVETTDAAVAGCLKASTLVQSDDPRLKAKAEEVLAGEKDALKAAVKLCEWTALHVRSTYSARLSNSLEVLDSLEGDCTEHTALFTGLARAAGIPAREVAGLVYTDGAKPGFYFHQWVEVWTGQWLAMDPTFNQSTVDATHIKLAEGDFFQQAKLIPLIGQIKIEEAPDGVAAAEKTP